mmetsp:Transcript_20716/g.64011  ORF Transcript_20716/g.64011 Transcript_20716/m.64011 type:complete len:620 (+) Transcript_20716:75-1934(+)
MLNLFGGERSLLEQEWFVSGASALTYGVASLSMVCLNHIILDDLRFPSTTVLLGTQVTMTFLASFAARLATKPPTFKDAKSAAAYRRLSAELSGLAKAAAPKMAALFVLDVALGHAAARWLGLDAFATLRRSCIPIAAHLEPRLFVKSAKITRAVVVACYSMFFGPLLAMALGNDRNRAFDATTLRGVVLSLASAAVVALRVAFMKQVLERASDLARNDVIEVVRRRHAARDVEAAPEEAALLVGDDDQEPQEVDDDSSEGEEDDEDQRLLACGSRTLSHRRGSDVKEQRVTNPIGLNGTRRNQRKKSSRDARTRGCCCSTPRAPNLKCRRLLGERDASFAVQFLCLTAASSLPLILAFGIAFDGAGIRQCASFSLVSRPFVATFATIVLLGPVHEVAVYCCAFTNSALTTLIAGGFKSTALSTYRAITDAPAKGKPYDLWEMAGMVITSAASLVYTYAWWKDQQAKEGMRRELEHHSDLVGIRFTRHTSTEDDAAADGDNHEPLAVASDDSREAPPAPPPVDISPDEKTKKKKKPLVKKKTPPPKPPPSPEAWRRPSSSSATPRVFSRRHTSHRAWSRSVDDLSDDDSRPSGGGPDGGAEPSRVPRSFDHELVARAVL